MGDASVNACFGYAIVIQAEQPLRFGIETVTSVTCLRIQIAITTQGVESIGWGEVPLNVQWAWPQPNGDSRKRVASLLDFATRLAHRVASLTGHPLEAGSMLIEHLVKELSSHPDFEDVPAAALRLVATPFDIAYHDAYSRAVGVGVYNLYEAAMMPDESPLLSLDTLKQVRESGWHADHTQVLPVWHLVGGLDPISANENRGARSLDDWIRKDGLTQLKVKLTGYDVDWDQSRLRDVANLAAREGVQRISIDFNGGCSSVESVHRFLDCTEVWWPAAVDLSFIEQPVPPTLGKEFDMVTISERVRTVADEAVSSPTDVVDAFELGWSGVALKTCKTQTQAVLMYAQARVLGLPCFVQDLTNPMLAQISHLLLAAYTSPEYGVESNAMQYYPRASDPEASVVGGAFHRVDGRLSIETRGQGFGYGGAERARKLPAPIFSLEF